MVRGERKMAVVFGREVFVLLCNVYTAQRNYGEVRRNKHTLGKRRGVKTIWMGGRFTRMSLRRSAVKLAVGVQISNYPRPAVVSGPLGGIL
jgi:hypothetical protein